MLRQTVVVAFAFALPAALLIGCDKKSEPAAAKSAAADDHHGHDHGPGGEHADAAADHHSGRVIDLGSATAGAFSLKATRDDSAIIAGKDAPIDVTVTPAAGSTAKVAAVRFWIGVENAKGSVKARAEIENPAEPNRWHVHAEIPSPLPAGSRLWVEVEDDKGGTAVASFDLKS